MTVYEFDDSKVGEQGVTVKCTQCGNLFKVKRRERTAELALGAVAARSPAYVPPAANVPSTQRTTVPGIPMISKQPTRTPQPTPTAQPHIEPGGWMIRVRSGEIYRCRALTTLQQWIVERKVTRDDEISRSGDQWKRLGGIAELASFFHIVEQAAAVARADGPRAAAEAANAAYSRTQREEDDPALVTTAPMAREPSGPIAMGNPIADDDPAFARTNPTPKLTPAGSMPVVDDDADDTLLDDEFAGHPRRRAGVWAGVLAALVLVGAGGYLAAFKRDAVLGLFAHKDARASEAYRQGREYFLLDSDDAFRNAAAAYERGHEADDKSALPLAGLAETMTSWAAYLRDDAHGLEMGAPSVTAASAAKTLRRDSQAHLDEAKKYAQDALALDSESPEVNRAMADYLRVDGAPAAEVERYLTRATAKAPSDAESAYVGGALAFREGNLDAAKTKLTQANTLNQAATQHTLLRASYLLARIALQTGDKAGAKTLLQSVLAANANHDRARALLATFDADTAPAPVAAQTPTPPPTPAAATAPSGKPATPPSGAAASGVAQSGAASKAEESNDYGKLIAQGDHLSENGHAKEARKLYDRALSVRPSGLEAIMGLGYCDLDGEKFSSAVDHFKRALALSPSYGDAIIGLAEAYKLRGDRHEALTWYKQYLSSQPNGPKATMAKNNIRDLEPRGATAPDPSSPAPPTTPPTTPPPAASPDEPKAPATATAKPPEEAKKPDATPDTTKDEPKKADDDKPVQLPRPPTSDEPPP